MRIQTTVFVVLAFASLLASSVHGQNKSKPPTSSEHFVQHTFKATDGTAIDFWLMSPAKIESGLKYPLVLSLHGRGGNTMAATVLGSEKFREQFPCFVMAPASTRAGVWALPKGFGKLKGKPMLPAALEAMESLMNEHPIDHARVYVTGQSMGGFGTFGAITLRPKVFAAAMPVCGGWDPGDADKIKHIAVWAFHGDQDKTVPPERSREMIKAIQDAGGAPKYTEYQGVGHNSWTKAYAAPETWEWLFTQKR